jgi:murein DD-endopeptidase MepM/ murein hydrolase activator NlpD
MPLAVRILLTLLPKNEKTLAVLIAILILPMVLIFFLVSSITTMTHVPAIKPEQIEMYKEASVAVFAEFGIMVPFKELIAIDAVRYKQDFRDASTARAIQLAKRFIKVVKKKDKDGNVITYYYKKPLETVVQEMIESGELIEGDLERIQRYLQFPWDNPTENPEVPGLPDGYIPIPGAKGLVFPVVGQWRLSDVFRDRYNPVTGKWESHKGIDLAAPEGTPVVAAKKGRVVLASPNGTAGNEVKIDHGDGTKTRYLHLHSIAVSEGQEVEAGQIIGAVGSTGQSTGSHLHFEILIHGKAVNPAPYLFK